MYADAAPIAADRSREEIDSITERVIGAGQRVSAGLGFGFLERVYENALMVELSRAGLHAEQQKPCKVIYREVVVGCYVTDLLVEGAVVVEVKAVAELDRAHLAQCIHYLRATGLRVGLLMNFGRPRLQWRRVVNNF